MKLTKEERMEANRALNTKLYGRYGKANYSYAKGKPYQIIDRQTGKHFYYKTQRGRDIALGKKMSKVF